MRNIGEEVPFEIGNQVFTPGVRSKAYLEITDEASAEVWRESRNTIHLEVVNELEIEVWHEMIRSIPSQIILPYEI